MARLAAEKHSAQLIALSKQAAAKAKEVLTLKHVPTSNDSSGALVESYQPDAPLKTVMSLSSREKRIQSRLDKKQSLPLVVVNSAAPLGGSTNHAIVVCSVSDTNIQF